MNTAINIVNIKGIEDNLVPNPTIRRIEQKNSANTTRTREVTCPNPSGSKNAISSPEKSKLNLGIACVNINIPIETLKTSSQMSNVVLLYFVVNIFCIIVVSFCLYNNNLIYSLFNFDI